MDYDLLKILSNSNKDIDNQKIMDYIAGKLTGDEDDCCFQNPKDIHHCLRKINGL